MSFKSVLAGLAPGGKNDSGREYAVSMAASFKAHVKGCSFAIEPDFNRSGWMDLPAELIESQVMELTKGAEAAGKKLLQSAQSAKVPAQHDIFRATLPAARSTFASLASVHDVVVMAQSARGLHHYGDVLAEAAIFSSGRPLIVVPRNSAEGFSATRVAIAWDGSPHAARAVALAMPILTRAKQIEVVVVGDKNRVKESRARDFVTNLERHGLNVEINTHDSEDDAETIARQAKTGRASLLVMGAYGHSRLREFVFGGVTRHMLTKAEQPVFLAH